MATNDEQAMGQPVKLTVSEVSYRTNEETLNFTEALKAIGSEVIDKEEEEMIRIATEVERKKENKKLFEAAGNYKTLII